MMSFLELFGLLVGLTVGIVLYMMLPRQYKVGAMVAVLCTLMLTAMTQPAFAAAANDNVLTEGQKELHETLKTTPHGNQYEGIEYPQVTGTALSDREITDRIMGEVPDNLKVSVSNGAVRISGKVANRRDAQQIVQDIKDIPGVHEVSYDLGLAS